MFLYFWLLDTVTLNYICYFNFFSEGNMLSPKDWWTLHFSLYNAREIVYKLFKNGKW